MLSREQNEMLTQTNAGTPMGAYFRRFWQPVALSEELYEPDSPPVRVNIMGQELVAFRDSNGELGVLDARCPHRGAHLFFGRNEECGLRCVYHGWKFDRHGKAMELPNVPADSNLHKTVRTTAYPVREFGEMIWAYLGPDAAKLPGGRLPELPQLEFGCIPATHRYVTKQLFECNWAQIMEGDLDTAHFSFLHMPAPAVPSVYHPHSQADEKRLRWMRDDPMPLFEVLEHECGFVVAGARQADGQKYWRMTQFLLPTHGTGPSTLPGETYHGFTIVPIDDTSCWAYAYSWNPDRPLGNEERDKLNAGWALICERDENYVPVRNVHNDFMIDRDEQKHRTFTGVKGLAEQDSMIQHSQGPIVDRTKEILTGTDSAVVRFRSVMLKGAMDLVNGQEPVAPTMPEAYRARPGSWLADGDLTVQQVMLDRFQDPLGRVHDDVKTAAE
jgi:phthalate 4,5-dioxygenase